jgi:hypothetical protein
MQFTKNTSLSKQSMLGLFVKTAIVFGLIFVLIFLLNKIDFPAPKKEIKKILPNENFKIVK